MANGIVWITTTWIDGLKCVGDLLQPLAGEGGLEVRLDAKGVHLSEEEVIRGIPGVVATMPSNDIYSERVFSEAKDLDPSTGMLMHSMVLSFVDESNITQRWTMLQGGEAQPAHDMHLTRIQ